MFDASKRRVCQIRVTRTSTPLQALTLMNDETFIEAGCQLAVTAPTANQSAIAGMFEHVVSRPPSPGELAELGAQFEMAVAHYRAHPEDAGALLGDLVESYELQKPSARAALAIIGMTLLNLDEAITRQ